MGSDVSDDVIKEYVPVQGKKPRQFGDKSDPFGDKGFDEQYADVNKPKLFGSG